MGGSLGAQVLNTVVPQALSLLPEDRRPLVTHQTGANNLASVEKAYVDLQVTGQPVAFIVDMAKQYADCDLVLCRAGALTIAELTAAGVASVLVPYPHAVDDHQTSNARFLSDHRAAILLTQAELTPQKLADLLLDLTREKLLSMAVAARQLAKPGATRRVAEACIEMSGGIA